MPVRKIPHSLAQLRHEASFRGMELSGFSDMRDTVISWYTKTKDYITSLPIPSIRSSKSKKEQDQPTFDTTDTQLTHDNDLATKNNSVSEQMLADVSENQAESKNPIQPPQPSSQELEFDHEKIKPIVTDPVPLFDYSQIAQEVSAFKRIIRVFLIIMLMQTGLLTGLLVRNQDFVGDRQDPVDQSTTTLVGTAGDGEPGIRILQDFRVNEGVVDVGFNVDVSRNAISTKDHNNCKTPVPPPQENGCGFTLIPSSLGLPLSGVHYQRVTFDVDASDTARLKIDIKNFERGDVTEDLGAWSNAGAKPFIQLPPRIENSDGIQVRFWTEEGDIVINQIRIEYVTLDQLKEVALKVADPIASNLSPESIGILYEDRNGDRLLTPQRDTPWTCKLDFPGVTSIKLDESNAAVLLRDDECFKGRVPDYWYTDDGLGALAPGNWILVFPNESIALPFQINRSAEQVTLELLETSPL